MEAEQQEHQAALQQELEEGGHACPAACPCGPCRLLAAPGLPFLDPRQAAEVLEQQSGALYICLCAVMRAHAGGRAVGVTVGGRWVGGGLCLQVVGSLHTLTTPIHPTPPRPNPAPPQPRSAPPHPCPAAETVPGYTQPWQLSWFLRHGATGCSQLYLPLVPPTDGSGAGMDAELAAQLAAAAVQLYMQAAAARRAWRRAWRRCQRRRRRLRWQCCGATWRRCWWPRVAARRRRRLS